MLTQNRRQTAKVQTKVFVTAACAFVFVEGIRIGLFVASGLGLLPLGLATAFSTASAIATPSAFGLVALWRRWVAVDKIWPLLLLALVEPVPKGAFN